MVKLPLDCHRYELGGPTQGRVVEMNVAVGCAGAPVSEQASRDVQAFPIHDRVGSVRVTQVMEPRVRHDSRHSGCNPATTICLCFGAGR